MRTMSSITFGTVLLAVASVTAMAQVSTSDAVRHVLISQQGGVVQVQVTSTTPLRDVVTAFCSEQQIQCTGTEFLSGFSVPAMTLTGSMGALVSTLLQATGMNYNITRTASGLPSELRVLGRAPIGTLPETVPALGASHLHAMSEPAHDSEPESAEESERSERVMEMVFGRGSSAAGDVRSGANVSNVGAAMQGANAKLPEFLPFPDQFGNPIRTSPAAPPTVLPFPDHNGNPIPITPAPVSGPPIPVER